MKLNLTKALLASLAFAAVWNVATFVLEVVIFHDTFGFTVLQNVVVPCVGAMFFQLLGALLVPSTPELCA